MLGIQGGNWENGAYWCCAGLLSPATGADKTLLPTGDERHQGLDDNDHGALAPSLQIPKNRSTGNLASIAETSDTPQDRSRSRIRFSFDASAAAAEHDSLTRLASPDGGAVDAPRIQSSATRSSLYCSPPLCEWR